MGLIYTPLQSAEFDRQSPDLQEYLKNQPVICVFCNQVIEGASHKLVEGRFHNFSATVSSSDPNFPLGPFHPECSSRWHYIWRARRDLGPYVENPFLYERMES